MTDNTILQPGVVVRTFELGGVVVPILATLNFQQTYENFGGSRVYRMMTGSANKVTHWTKLKTSLSGSGPIPAGLANVDYSVANVLKCGAKRAISGATNVIAVPSARRTDPGYEPVGFALVNGELVKSSSNLAGDVLTISTVAGATSYVVHYWPEITVVSPGIQTVMDVHGAEESWTLDCEEV